MVYAIFCRGREVYAWDSGRVLELVYTSWDIVSFADDVWKDSLKPLRSAIEKQWDQSIAEAGFIDSDTPEWAEIDPESIPFNPAVWNEDRRARIRAELDAYYARLYGLTEEELRYILDPPFTVKISPERPSVS
jgi:hypothetical protein